MQYWALTDPGVARTRNQDAYQIMSLANNLLNAQAEKLNALLQFLIKKSVVAYYQGVSYIQQEF